MSEARATLKEMHRSGVDTSLIVRIDQVTGGEAECHCGAPAVLVVLTEPDGEPGATCFEHALVWIGSTVDLTYKLFGPKETQ